MSDASQEKRFHQLLSLLLDDEINPEQLAELTQLVRSNQSYSDTLRDQLQMAEGISQYENASRSSERFSSQFNEAIEAEEDAADFVDKVVQLSESDRPSLTISKTPWYIAFGSLAAAIAFAFLHITSSPELGSATAHEEIDQGVAVVSTLVGSLKQHEDSRGSGDTISPGILELESGYATLEFYSGAQVMVAGPAKLELIDSMRLICHQGKLRAHVPKVAHGFTIDTPASKLVDLGTEFGVNVDDSGQTELHVFDGEVEAYNTANDPHSRQLVTAGLALQFQQGGNRRDIPVKTAHFDDLTRISKMYAASANSRFKQWEEVNAAAKKDKRLIAYYDFQPTVGQGRTLSNQSLAKESLNGAIVGATWSEGPWPGKKALSFKRPGDQVRINIPGEYEALTYAAWIKVDGLDRSHNSLLLTDGWDIGEPHWQFRKNGMLSLGIRYNEDDRDGHVSDPFVDLSRLGQWFHLCSVVNPKTQTVAHYVNGVELGVEPLNENNLYKIGPASIGNWGNPIEISEYQIRNLNGHLAEMMIFSEALSQNEVKKLALK